MNSLMRSIVRSGIKRRNKHKIYNNLFKKAQCTVYYATVSGKDYYQILGINKDSKEADIKKAFIKLAKMYHPDVNKTPEAHKKFVEINSAYHTLMDPQKKALYDQQQGYSSRSSSSKTSSSYRQQKYSHQTYNQQSTKQSGRPQNAREKEQDAARRKRENEEEASYEQSYRNFQNQFEEMIRNMRQKQSSNAAQDQRRAQEAFFRNSNHSVRGEAYRRSATSLMDYYGYTGLQQFMNWYHAQYGQLYKEFVQNFMEVRNRGRIDESRNPLRSDPFLNPDPALVNRYGFFGRGGYGGYFNEKDRLSGYFMRPNYKFYDFLMQNRTTKAYDPLEFPPYVSIREGVMPQSKNITMLLYSESEAYMGSLQESYVSSKIGSILKWFYEGELLGKARGYIDPQLNIEKIIIEDANSKRVAKLEESQEQNNALSIVRSIFRHTYIIYDPNDRIVGRMVKERSLFGSQKIAFYDSKNVIMAISEQQTGPAGGDLYDLDIADENRMQPIVFNFALAFHTIGVRRRNETLLAKLNKAGKSLVKWFTSESK